MVVTAFSSLFLLSFNNHCDRCLTIIGLIFGRCCLLVGAVQIINRQSCLALGTLRLVLCAIWWLLIPLNFGDTLRSLVIVVVADCC